MDLTSLLNVPSRPKPHHHVTEPTFSSRTVKGSGDIVTILPTPSPERTSSRRGSDTGSSSGRRPWNAGGYKIPTSVETKPSFHTRTTSRSPSAQLGSPISRGRSSFGGHSRQASMDSSPPEITESQGATPPTGTRLLRSPILEYDRADELPDNSYGTGSHSRREPARLPGWDEQYGIATESAGASGHRFSDSRSSLSSFGSSHSRISSVTTVSMVSSIASTLTEMPLLEDKLAASSEPRLMPTVEEWRQPAPLPGLREYENADTLTHGDLDRPTEPVRPGSPSDAILHLKDSSIRGRNDAEPSSRSAAFREGGYLSASPKLHKRAISAPDFAPISTSVSSNNYRRRLVLPPLHQTMVPPLLASTRGNLSSYDTTSNVGQSIIREEPGAPQLVGDRSGDATTSFASETALHPGAREHQASSARVPASVNEDATTSSNKASSPLLNDREPTPEEPVLRCMFVENCNTGSNQLRKAISHFFGRNKSCTKLIPKEVWVYFCRKHYQRCRYRNAKTYPDNQIGYVITQIERIKNWDVENQQSGSNTHIKSWQFALRKREKNRLQHEPADAEDDEFDQLASSDITAPPQWVLDAVDRNNYSTDDILGFAQRLQQEIRDGHLGGIPEVEFLPVIEGGKQADSGKASGKKTRKQSRSNSDAKATKRKAADSPDLPSLLPPDINTRFASRPEPDSFELLSPSEKRPRLDDRSGFSQHQPSRMPAPFEAHPNLPAAPHFPTSHQPHGYGGYENPGPARAPNVVPMVQHGFGQSPPRFGHGYHASSPQVSLPSISSQMRGGPSRPAPFQHGSADPSGLRTSNHGQFRTMHQRSTSAFTPVNRPTAAFTRPSSSGHDAPFTQPRFPGRQQETPSYGGGSRGTYGDQRPAPQYVYDHGMRHHYGHDHGAQQHGYSSNVSQESDPRRQPTYDAPSHSALRAPVATMAERVEDRMESGPQSRSHGAEERHGIPGQ